MDSGFETSNESTDSAAEIATTFQIAFKNASISICDYRKASTSFSVPNTSSASSEPHSWKMKSRHQSQRMHKFDEILSPSKKKRLAMAAMTNNVELVDDLLSNGKVNANSADVFKRTALHLAASRGYANVCETLINYGANPNLKDSLGNTPLHLAACAWNIPVITALLNGGAKCMADNNNRTPFDLAISKYRLRLRDASKGLAPHVTSYQLSQLYMLFNLDAKSKDKVQTEDDLKNLLDNLSLTE